MKLSCGGTTEQVDIRQPALFVFRGIRIDCWKNLEKNKYLSYSQNESIKFAK